MALPLTTTTRVLLLFATFAAATPLAACEEETIAKLHAGPGFDPNPLDFGEVTLEQRSTRTVTLRNTGAAVFTIESSQIDQYFTISDPKDGLEGRTIGAGSSMSVDITFYAGVAQEITGKLTVSGGGSDAVLNLRGVGVERQVPNLAIDPTSLDFGTVQLNTQASKDVTITNTGNAQGVIDRVTLQSTGTDVNGSDEYRPNHGLPITIDPGASVTVPIVFNPTHEGTRADTMFFGTSGGTPLQLNLTGEGKLAAGDIICDPSSLAFGQVERGQTKQLQTVCTASGGPARLIGASIRALNPYFRIDNPPGTADLNPGDSVTLTVTYAPDGLPDTHNGTLEVAYSGDRGTSNANVALTGEVVPPPPTATAISLVLRWNSNDTDVDIHLTRPNAIPFSPLGGDCFFGNMNPDWGTQGDTTDNPFLDRDDIEGPGPENLNLSQTGAGDYKVWAHYYSDHNHGDTTATVEVYVAGNLAGTFTHRLACNDMWNVGVVHWTGNGGTFAPSTTVTQDSHGSCR